MMLRCGELGKRAGLCRMQVHRLAKKPGGIPGTRISKGGHFYFVKCPALDRWIGERQWIAERRRIARLRQPSQQAARRPYGRSLRAFYNSIRDQLPRGFTFPVLRFALELAQKHEKPIEKLDDISPRELRKMFKLFEHLQPSRAQRRQPA